jgi:mRNA interferase MazF
MRVNQYEVWLADLNPRFGTEPGKKRPVVIVQTDLLNNEHPSIIVCPLTTHVVKGIEILRIHLHKNQLDKPSDILVDQVRAVDNRRLLKKIGKLDATQIEKLKHNLAVILDL